MGEPSPRWDRRQWATLLVLSGNMILDAIEVSVVLVALPVISARFGVSLWDVQWLMSGFALGFAVMLLLGPAVTARLGRRRAYLGAMLLFAAASLVGGIADDLALLVATRVVKGFCAALTAPTGLAIISTTFSDDRQRRKAVSAYAMFGAAGFTTGLLLSGVLLEASWRWTFLFPAPVALVLLVLGLRLIPSGHVSAPRPAFALLRNGTLLRSALGAATLNGTYASLLLLVTFQSHDEFGWAPWQIALALLPACLPLAVTVPFAARLVARFGTKRLIALGALSPLLGYAWYLWRPGTGSYADGMLPTLLLVGLGFVLSFAALNMQATSTIAAEDRGAAVSLYQTAVQLGGVLLLPLTALLLTAGHRPALLLITATAAVGLFAALRPETRKVPL